MRSFKVVSGAFAGLGIVALMVLATPARAQDFSGQWTCSYVSFDGNSQNRIERSYTMFLYPNNSYELAGTHVSSLIGVYERFVSRGEWRIGGLAENKPYVQAGGPASFNSGRNEHFTFWGWIRGPDVLASEYRNGAYQNQTSCAR